jgi:hypothetical protein
MTLNAVRREHGCTGARVDERVLFDGEGAVVRDSILSRDGMVTPGAVLDRAVVGDGAGSGSAANSPAASASGRTCGLSRLRSATSQTPDRPGASGRLRNCLDGPTRSWQANRRTQTEVGLGNENHKFMTRSRRSPCWRASLNSLLSLQVIPRTQRDRVIAK